MNFVKNNVEYHRELNPKVWDNGHLIPEVRLALMRVAKVFMQYLELPGFKLEDIVLTGSNANYNYTDYSDFDIHIVSRYSDLDADSIVEAFYQAKKKIWNDQHDITVRGYETEMYVEDINHPPVAGGVYSLLNDEWIKRPKYNPPDIDDSAVNSKVRDLIRQITDAISSKDAVHMKRIIDKISNMRKAGLARAGEYGTENLAFKILRNIGYIEKIHKAYTAQQDQDLSLEGQQ
jgi:hypothetical protein